MGKMHCTLAAVKYIYHINYFTRFVQVDFTQIMVKKSPSKRTKSKSVSKMHKSCVLHIINNKGSKRSLVDSAKASTRMIIMTLCMAGSKHSSPVKLKEQGAGRSQSRVLAPGTALCTHSGISDGCSAQRFACASTGKRRFACVEYSLLSARQVQLLCQLCCCFLQSF